MELFFEIKSIVQTQQQYQRHFAVRKSPDRKTIWMIVKKFQTERLFIMLKNGDLAELEELELNRTSKLFVCLLFRVQNNLADNAPKSWV